MPAAKKRACPALGTTIPAKTCGADRLSRIPCPASCPFNPFAPEQYDEFSSIELQLIRKQQDRLTKIAARNGDSREIDTIINAKDDFSGFHAQFLAGWRNRNAAGQSFFTAWESDHWDGLSNDERVLASHFQNAHAAILEVRQVLDDQSTEVIDLLDPAGQPFVIVDRTIASRAGRFSLFLIFIYKAPLFFRSVGTLVSLPDFPQLDPIDTIRAIASHHGGPSSLSELRSWLEQHAPLVFSTVSKAHGLRTRPTASQLPPGSWAYNLTGTPEAVTAILSTHDDAHPEGISDAEIDDGYDDAFLVSPGENQPFGRLLVGPPGVIASCLLGSQTTSLPLWIENTLGSTVILRPDPAAAAHPDVPAILLSKSAPTATEAHAVPKSTSTGDWLREFGRKQTALFFSEANPLLEGKSPEAAAAFPPLRPILVRLCKQHISGIDYLRRSAGIDTDANDILARLGLTEIIFPPAPLGKPLEDPRVTSFPTAAQPTSPPLRLPILTSADRKFFRRQKSPLQNVLDADRILKGIRSMVAECPSEEDVINWFEAAWGDLLDLILIACEDHSDLVYTHCISVASRAAWVLFAQKLPEEATDNLRFAFFLEEATDNLREITDIRDEQELMALASTTPQPLLACGMVASLSATTYKNQPHPLSEAEARIAIPIAIAAIRELCMLKPR